MRGKGHEGVPRKPVASEAVAKPPIEYFKKSRPESAPKQPKIHYFKKPKEGGAKHKTKPAVVKIKAKGRAHKLYKPAGNLSKTKTIGSSALVKVKGYTRSRPKS